MGNKKRNHLNLRQTSTTHGDVNKKQMLSFKELDDNFIFLKERDVKEIKLTGNDLVYETLGGDEITVDLSSLGGGGSSLWTESGDDIRFDTGDVYIGWRYNYKHLHVNGNINANLGFTNGTYEYGMSGSIINSHRGTSTGSFSATLGAGNSATGLATLAIGSNVTASGEYSFAGGYSPYRDFYVVASGEASFAFLESTNNYPQVGALADNSVALGGKDNIVYNQHSSILGGRDNVISGSSEYSAIIGGRDNRLESNSYSSVILGGEDIVATEAMTAYVSRLNIGSVGNETANKLLAVDSNGKVVDGSSLASGGGGSSLWTESGDDIKFTTGDVGIGTNPNSDYKLNVNGKIYSSLGFKVSSYEYGIGNSIIKSYGGSVTGMFSATLGAGNNATGTQTFAIGNQVTASGNYSFAGGSSSHSSNEVIAGGEGAFVFLEGTSEFPEVGAFSDWSVTLGGSDNIISSDSNANSVILGGRDHVISGGSSNTAIIGGIDNKIESNADYSVILGGRDIVATEQNTAYVSRLNIGSVGTGTANKLLAVDSSGKVVDGSSLAGAGDVFVGSYSSGRVSRWDTTTNTLTTSIIRDDGDTIGINQDPVSWGKFYVKSTSSDETTTLYSVKSGSVSNANVFALRGYSSASGSNSSSKIFAGVYGHSNILTGSLLGNYVGGYFRHGDQIDNTTGTGSKDAAGVLVSVDTKFSMVNIYGIKIDRMNISKTISGGVYGLRIKAFTGSGNAAGGKYGIYQDGSVETNHFNGATTINNDLTVTTIASASNLAADSNGKLISVPSDSNLKENITSIESGVLDKIKQIKTYKFNFVEELNMGDGDHFGHIAQEVQEIYPELITNRAGDEEHLTLNYVEMVPLLLQAIKEQQSIIDEIKNDLEVLKNK